MKIGGLLKFSLIDYPDHISAVIFTQGCNFRCPYCHNSDLVIPEKFGKTFSEDEVLLFLKNRIGKLNGVVITGGEPTLQGDLIDFIKKIKSMGYLVKLDTNGSRPDVVENVIGLGIVDYIAMDVKASLDRYDFVTGTHNMQESIKKSIKIIIESGINHEFRTTLVKTLVSKEDIKKIVELVKGTNRYKIQQFIPRNTNLDKALGKDSSELFSEEEIIDLKNKWQVGV